MTNGQVIAFDGPDGIGKSTQLRLLAEYLTEQGKTVYSTRASGGTPIGEALRAVSLSEHSRPAEVDLYISLAMHTALGYDLQEKRTQYDYVLVDRSPLAIVAYQSYGSQLPNPQDGFDACRKMLKLWELDELVALTAPQDILDKRRAARATNDASQNNNYFERQNHDYHLRVQEGYIAATAAEKETLQTRLIEIDGTGSIQSVHNAIKASLGL